MINCKNCATEFEPKTKLNIFCCRNCRNKFHNRTNRSKLTQKEATQKIANNIKHLVTQEEGESLIQIKDKQTIIDKKYEKAINQLTLYVDRKKYVKINSYVVSLHRLIWYLEYNTYPKLFIDHIDINTFNNKISNLRLANLSQSSSNRAKTKSKKNSKFKGVHRTASGKYQAMIWYNGKNHGVGSFDTEEEAALAYNTKAKEMCGDYAYQNIVIPNS